MSVVAERLRKHHPNNLDSVAEPKCAPLVLAATDFSQVRFWSLGLFQRQVRLKARDKTTIERTDYRNGKPFGSFSPLYIVENLEGFVAWEYLHKIRKNSLFKKCRR